MKPDPRDKNSLREFFHKYRGLTNVELATMADCATCTIVDWKRRCGVIEDGYVKPPKPPPQPVNDWDNKEWFEEHYVRKGMGFLAIAALIGKPNNWDIVRRRLRRYKIKRRTREESVGSDNPCCEEGWLQYYYSRRKEYEKWCEERGIEPDEEGGQGLTLHQCGAEAGVSHQTIANWLALFQIKARGLAEAQIKDYNHSYGRAVPLKEIRRARDAFFEVYRAGQINMIIRGKRYSNGKRVDREETFAQRFGRLPRGSSKCRKGTA
jgi:transposase